MESCVAGDPRRALVLFSGGQDSTTCLAYALDRYAHVETIGFDYAQRQPAEAEARIRVRAQMGENFPRWRKRLGADHVLDLSVTDQLAATALASERESEMNAGGLPNTFVPGRNLLFFTLAAIVADRRKLSVLIGGMCETDDSGYPDCRDNALKSLQVAMSLGMDTPMTIDTPLMWLDKAGTWALGERLGGEPLIELVVEHTHSCYLGDREHLHAWGYGCGLCPACDLRRKGYEAWLAS
jgi:7-cyano-7-deazaguanine synthase